MAERRIISRITRGELVPRFLLIDDDDAFFNNVYNDVEQYGSI
jgi:hypothetical protein